MKASVIRNGKFVTIETAIPSPGPGEVLVKNLACGICGSDLHLLKLFQKRGSQDVTLGHEFCSEIVSFGTATKQYLDVGQRVCSVPFLKANPKDIQIGTSPQQAGAYAEYMVLSEEYLLPVPDGTPTDAAVLTEPFAVALHAIEKSSLCSDDIPLVIGCGPIGLAIIAILRQRGLGLIIASDFSDSRRRLAQKIGASEVLNPAEENVFEHYNRLVSDSPKASVIYECVGAAQILGQICKAAPSHSRVIMAGLCTDNVTFNPYFAMEKELNIQYVFYYEYPEYAEALKLLSSGQLNWKPFITGKVGLNGVTNAFDQLRTPEGHAKIVIDPWQDGTVVNSAD